MCEIPLIGEVYKVKFISKSHSVICTFSYLSEEEIILNVLNNDHDSWVEKLEDTDGNKNIDHAIEVLASEPNLDFHYAPDLKSIVISKLKIAEYYPRIWRGVYSQDYFEYISTVCPSSIYGAKYTQSLVAADSLFKSVEELFRYYEPSVKNKEAFGHRNRELLILICTEIENSWRYILRANFQKEPEKDRYTTNDYIKLFDPLRLGEWTVELADYPGYPVLCPFQSWNQSLPTKSIPWYDAYNSVKHDREGEFERATLAHLLDSAAALHIILCAQWGPYSLSHTIFDIVNWPSFEIKDQYIPPIRGGDWVQKPYFS